MGRKIILQNVWSVYQFEIIKKVFPGLKILENVVNLVYYFSSSKLRAHTKFSLK